MVFAVRLRATRRVADAVLIAQVLFDLRVDVLDRLVRCDFEIRSAGFVGHAVQALFAMLAGDGQDRAYDRTREILRVGKANGVDDGVRALGVFDGFGDGS